ncbi:uncharacterized protein K452DRAFT_277181 [Aplosporella prunicola CBS 121167]|uniref:Carboxylic ester hydrolase n=1 Tax=Aplosporella prunicola CBS 121167 TaxID=1176127 RepID=A0A6A6B1X9_9PEZI|nr:uncharacterized protein K452DRAFT_277181 [Aplosporella prunicola CBS 121167]KAF2138189.1 hypothetical protein K452DRAFT_277181 [Aplosporella prunicola CBS 121167]
MAAYHSYFVALSIFLLFASKAAAKASNHPFVTILNKTYEGISTTLLTEEFRGIRYGQSPTGGLRFTRPQPFDPTGRIDARHYGPGCPQGLQYTTEESQDEDCLFLNIVRPSLRSKEPLPVICWLHGGAYRTGQASLYNGTALVSQSIQLGLPVIYVGINYRLNGFGFLASSKLLQSGDVNLGLHDQELALRWISRNIAWFGGNKDRITLFGESAGSAETWAHIVRQERSAESLFQGAALISGAPGGIWPHVDDAALYDAAFQNLVDTTGCRSATNEVDCLRRQDFKKLDNIFNGINSTWEKSFKYSIGIVKDEYWFNSSAWQSLIDQKFADLPLLVGYNHDEGTRLYDCTHQSMQAIDLIRDAAYAFNDSTLQWALSLYATYLEILNISLIDVTAGGRYASSSNQITTFFYTDLYFASGVQKVLDVVSKSQNIWGYRFDQMPPYSAINLSYGYPGTSVAKAACMGTYHSSMLSYLFGDVQSLVDATVYDKRLSKFIMEGWLSFATYGYPKIQNSTQFTWDPYNYQGKILDLKLNKDAKPTMLKNVFREKSLALISKKVSESQELYTPV